MKRLFALMAAAAIMFSTMAASAPTAPDVQVNATGDDASYLYVLEQGKANDGRIYGDKAIVYKVDTGNIANLNNFTLGLWAGCDGLDQDWNNCITSIDLHLRAGTCVGFWDGSSYGGTLLGRFGSRTQITEYVVLWEGTSDDNKASSLKWGDWKYVASSSGYQCVYGSY